VPEQDGFHSRPVSAHAFSDLGVGETCHSRRRSARWFSFTGRDRSGSSPTSSRDDRCGRQFFALESMSTLASKCRGGGASAVCVRQTLWHSKSHGKLVRARLSLSAAKRVQ